jgi:hypothetical protein
MNPETPKEHTLLYQRHALGSQIQSFIQENIDEIQSSFAAYSNVSNLTSPEFPEDTEILCATLEDGRRVGLVAFSCEQRKIVSSYVLPSVGNSVVIQLNQKALEIINNDHKSESPVIMDIFNACGRRSLIAVFSNGNLKNMNVKLQNSHFFE